MITTANETKHIQTKAFAIVKHIPGVLLAHTKAEESKRENVDFVLPFSSSTTQELEHVYFVFVCLFVYQFTDRQENRHACYK